MFIVQIYLTVFTIMELTRVAGTMGSILPRDRLAMHYGRDRQAGQASTRPWPLDLKVSRILHEAAAAGEGPSLAANSDI